MAVTVLVCGKTGTGKTTAIRTLNPKETAIFKVINRTLPFKEAKGYVSKRNMYLTPEYSDVLKGLDWANKQPGVKNIVITDATYIIRQEFMKRAKEVGYTKFTEIAQHMQQIISAVQNMRDDIKVIMEYHVEGIQSDSGITEYKAATVGNLLDQKYNIFENVDIILFASPQFEDKNIKYGFFTNRTIDREGAELPAKSPLGMFEELFIPNDLQYVAQHIDAYYNE